MAKITLKRQNGVWCARHDDPRVRELFGTDTLPTAWRDTAAANAVLADIRAHNAGVEVVLDPAEPEARKTTWERLCDRAMTHPGDPNSHIVDMISQVWNGGFQQWFDNGYDAAATIRAMDALLAPLAMVDAKAAPLRIARGLARAARACRTKLEVLDALDVAFFAIDAQREGTLVESLLYAVEEFDKGVKATMEGKA